MPATCSFFAPISSSNRCCMVCLRHHTNSFNPQLGVGFEVDCVFSSATSTRCDRCKGNNDSCSFVSAALLGDFKDMVSLVSALSNAINETDPAGAPILRVDELESLAMAQLSLATAFEHMELEHRKAWGLTGSKKDSVGNEQAYQAHVAGRRALLVSRLAPLGVNAGAAARAAHASALIPRLLAGDTFYDYWNLAKRSFMEEVEDAIAAMPVAYQDLLLHSEAYGFPDNVEIWGEED